MELRGTIHLKQRRRAFFHRDLEQNKRNVTKEKGTRIDRTIKADPLSLNNLKTYAVFHAFLNQYGTSDCGDDNLFTINIFDDHFPCSYSLHNQLTQYFSYKEKV